MNKLKCGILLCLSQFFISQSSYALTTCNVTLSSDNSPGTTGDPGDLRNCINTMNAALSGIPDDYAIVFDFPMTIQLNGILPVINNSANPVTVTIGNPGSTATVTIDGNSGAYSGFFIPEGNVIIQNMNFQNLSAKGGNGGNGMTGGGGGLGAGAAIYTPTTFLNGSGPLVTLMNVAISNSTAIGGNGGNYSLSSPSGFEGGGGGGGLYGNGGSILTVNGQSTGGGGGGGFGGNGGDVTLSTSDLSGGGGGGGGGWGSRALIGTLSNLGNGGSDQNNGTDGNGFGLSITAGSGAGTNTGGASAGGGGGGADTSNAGGGGGGSNGGNGLVAQGNIPPLRTPTHGSIHKRPGGKPVSELLRALSERAAKAGAIGKTLSEKLLKESAKAARAEANAHQSIIVPLKTHGGSAVPSGGTGGDGAGSGGAGVVITNFTNGVDGQAGGAGYGGGGGGGSGVGASDINYTVQGGLGGTGGGGGGGGVNFNSTTPADGGSSLGGGGGGGGGPANGATSAGGTDQGHLGGGAGGTGASTVGSSFGGGGGGGGSGLGAAIFVDSSLNFTIQAMSGIPTTFNTPNNTVQSGTHGTGGGGGSDGTDGSALGNSIFMRSGASLTFMAQNVGDVLTLGDQVSFADDTSFGMGGTAILVRGDGTVIYQGTTDYQGQITINNANFKVTGVIDNTSIFVCRDNSSSQRGTLSGTGTLTGSVLANSGAISPDTGATLTLGSLFLSSASGGSIGSLVHSTVNSGGASLVAVTGSASLAGVLEINLDANTPPGHYTLLTSSGITGTFDSVSFTGQTPNYTISYLPVGSPTFVQLDFQGFPSTTSVDIPATVNGLPIINPAVVCCGRPVILGDLPVPGTGPTTYSVVAKTGSVTCQLGQTQTQQYLRMEGKSGSCTIEGTKEGVVSNPLTVIAQ